MTHIGLLLRILIECIFRLEEHFVDERVFRKVLDPDIEDVFSRLAVGPDDKLLHDLQLVELLGNEIGSEVHCCCDEDLFKWVLKNHIGDYGREHSSFASSRWTLD